MTSHLKSLSRSILSIRRSLKRSKGLIKTAYFVSGCCFSRASDEKPLLNTSCQNAVKDLVSVQNEIIQHQPDSAFPSTSTDRAIKQYLPPPKVIKCKGDESAVGKVEKGSAIQQESHAISVNQVLKNDLIEFSEPPLKRFKAQIKNLQSEELEQTNKKSKEKNCNFSKPKKERPNYFVAIKISNSRIHEEVKNLQDHMLKQDAKIRSSLIEINTLHITLMVMHIPDTETHIRALKALHNVHEEHDNIISKNPLYLEFEGLGHFQNRVLYAQMSQDDGHERLLSLQKSVIKHFALASIHSTDDKESFTPHLTVAKIKFKNKEKLKKINPSLYKDFSDQYFGSQTVESVQLLKMTEKEKETGYYVGDEIYFSAFKPTAPDTCYLDSSSIEDKKKEIKELIHQLTVKKLGLKE